MQQPNDYIAAGFDQYLTRSIDGYIATGLGNAEPRAGVQQVAFDRNQVTGSLGDKLKLGFIVLDGTTGRISIFDANNNEPVRIGELDG